MDTQNGSRLPLVAEALAVGLDLTVQTLRGNSLTATTPSGTPLVRVTRELGPHWVSYSVSVTHDGIGAADGRTIYASDVIHLALRLLQSLRNTAIRRK